MYNIVNLNKTTQIFETLLNRLTVTRRDPSIATGICLLYRRCNVLTLNSFSTNTVVVKLLSVVVYIAYM